MTYKYANNTHAIAKALCIALVLNLFLVFPALSADEEVSLSSGQTVYVPIYSHVFSGPKGKPFNLMAMMSIRNTDLHNPITIVSATYYDNDGKRLREYAPKPLTIGPLASHHFSIDERDESGGFSAKFIVRWKAGKKINAPMIQGVMISTRSTQGISFVSAGKVISEATR